MQAAIFVQLPNMVVNLIELLISGEHGKEEFELNYRH
jgi:hypothetical protein